MRQHVPIELNSHIKSEHNNKRMMLNKLVTARVFRTYRNLSIFNSVHLDGIVGVAARKLKINIIIIRISLITDIPFRIKFPFGLLLGEILVPSSNAWQGKGPRHATYIID